MSVPTDDDDDDDFHGEDGTGSSNPKFFMEQELAPLTSLRSKDSTLDAEAALDNTTNANGGMSRANSLGEIEKINDEEEALSEGREFQSRICGEWPNWVKLLVGAGGIYAAFLYYGSLQEDVFRYESPVDGKYFEQAWFLQVLEAAANVVVGYIGLRIQGPTQNLPKSYFFYSGAAQVSGKAFNSLALAAGLSFPVATLAKSAKMAPVMAGSLLLGGERYNWLDYAQVALIISGTAMVSAGSKRKSGQNDTLLGVVYIVLSLIMGGVVGGFQKRLQRDMAALSIQPKPYDYMYWTNLFMCVVALVVSLFLGDLRDGIAYCYINPEILWKILQFSACSAIGQTFVFYLVAEFDPLVTSTVTTSRKLFSVLISILFKGNSVDSLGWAGMLLAAIGIMRDPISQCLALQSAQH